MGEVVFYVVLSYKEGVRRQHAEEYSAYTPP